MNSGSFASAASGTMKSIEAPHRDYQASETEHEVWNHSCFDGDLRNCPIHLGERGRGNARLFAADAQKRWWRKQVHGFRAFRIRRREGIPIDPVFARFGRARRG